MKRNQDIKPPPRPSLKNPKNPKTSKRDFEAEIKPQRPRSLLLIQSEREFNRSIEILKGSFFKLYIFSQIGPQLFHM
jgi:hypothetical protein